MLKNITYEKAIQTLTSAGRFHIKLGTERVKEFLKLFHDPQNRLNCIHVAGTNGKGSTCAMLASIFSEAGYKAGLYTSPHLIEYTERIKIGGIDISKEEFSEILFEITEKADENDIHLTEFEILTVLAFIYFYRKRVDIAIIETGLGGRLDATNVINKPLFSIITSVDIDHADRLGETAEKIAYEKSGIIKNYVPVITLQNNNGINVIKEQANLKRSRVIFSKDQAKYFNHLINPASYQEINLSLVETAIELIKEKGINIREEHIINGLQKLNWPARFQYIEKHNLIVDGAHNPAAARELRKSIDKYFADKRKIWIYSSLNSKDFKKVAEILFKNDDTVILTKNISSASIEPEKIEKSISMLYPHFKFYTAPDIENAFNTYKKFSDKNSVGIIAGSLYTAGDLLARIK